jgi:predicted transcriptional regulator
MQAAATRFGVAVVWIHHLKPGAGKGDMGIDATGGNSNINQIPFCVHTLHKVQIKGYQHVVRWNAEKYRGEPSRAFNYTLDRDGGLFEIVQGALEEDRTSEILEQLWIQRDCGVGITELVDAVDAAKKTIQNKLTQLAKDGKVANVKRRWCITPAGAEILGNEQPELNPAINEWLLSLK